MRHHYVDLDGEPLCGGDGCCDAVELEPICVEGWAHRWGATRTRREADDLISASRCLRCGTVQVETLHLTRVRGQCDEVIYCTPEEL